MIRLVFWCAFMALGLLNSVTASAQGFSEAFSNAYRQALEDTAVKFEYLKPKAAACDSLVLSLHRSLTETKLAYAFYQKTVTVQAELNAAHAQKERKVEKKKNIRTGRKQGFALAVGPPLIYLILKSFL